MTSLPGCDHSESCVGCGGHRRPTVTNSPAFRWSVAGACPTLRIFRICGTAAPGCPRFRTAAPGCLRFRTAEGGCATSCFWTTADSSDALYGILILRHVVGILHWEPHGCQLRCRVPASLASPPQRLGHKLGGDALGGLPSALAAGYHGCRFYSRGGPV